MRKATSLAVVLGCVLMCSATCFAQYTNSSSVLDGCGGWCSNATYKTLIAAHQPCPVGFNQSASHLNYSGFLQTFVLHTNLDTDADGILDENDPDNDGDGLDDSAELGGTSFSPNTVTDTQLADSDDDGASDGHEAGAGTDPWNAGSLLEVTRMVGGSNAVQVVWKSRQGYTYDVLAVTNLDGLAAVTAVVDTVVGGAGVGPFLETMSTSATLSAEPGRFYLIEKK